MTYIKMHDTQIEAVLFDLDGTLLDTANDLGEALNFVLRNYDQPEVERDIYRPVASDGAKGLLELGFNEALASFDYDILRNQFLDYYENNIAIHTRLYPGVSELLEKLNEKSIPWGVVTNKPEGLTKKLLPYFSEFERCAVIVGGDTLASRKPDPEPLFYACQIMNVSADKTIYIGDALRDIQAGNSANMMTIAAAWGYIKPSDNIHMWKADRIEIKPEECLTFNKTTS